jgi:hypothetical protein
MLYAMYANWIIFRYILSTYSYSRSSENNKNVWVKVMYKCTKSHLFCTHELLNNYNSRIEKHNTLVNENLNLKTKIKELKLLKI